MRTYHRLMVIVVVIVVGIVLIYHGEISQFKQKWSTYKVNIENNMETISGTSSAIYEIKHDLKANDSTKLFTNSLGSKRLERADSSSRTEHSNGLLKFDRVSCKPLDVKLLLFNKIPKTGSSTMEAHLKRIREINNFKLAPNSDWHSARVVLKNLTHFDEFAEDFSRRVGTRYAALSAHFFFREHFRIPLPHTYISIVRNPVDRVLSHYFYARDKGLRRAEKVERFKRRGYWNESINECVLNQRWECFDNKMTFFLCGAEKMCRTGSTEAINRAKFNMRHFYSAIGTTDSLSDFMKILQTRLPRFFGGQALLENRKENRNKKYAEIVTESTRRLIASRNTADMQIYEYAKKLMSVQQFLCENNISRTSVTI